MTLIELARKLRPIIEKSAQNLDDATALEAVTLFPAWAAGIAYTAGTKVRHGGVLLFRVAGSYLTSKLGARCGTQPFCKGIDPRSRCYSRMGATGQYQRLQRVIKYALRVKCIKALLIIMSGVHPLIPQVGSR